MLQPAQDRAADRPFLKTYKEQIGPMAPTDNAASLIQMRIMDIVELQAIKADMSVVHNAYQRLIELAIASYDDGALLVGRVMSPAEAHEKVITRLDDEFRAYQEQTAPSDITVRLIGEQAQLLLDQAATLDRYEADLRRLRQKDGAADEIRTDETLEVGAPTIALAGSLPTVELQLNNSR